MKSIFIILLLCVQVIFANHADSTAKNYPVKMYDWRNTDLFGFGGGIVTGVGLQWRHWNQSDGFQITVLPFYIQRSSDDYIVLSLGGAKLFSLNKPEASPLGEWGFSNLHAFWLIGGGALYKSDRRDKKTYGGALSGGIGLELNRSFSNFSIIAGVGPTYYRDNEENNFRFLITGEVSWMFGIMEVKK